MRKMAQVLSVFALMASVAMSASAQADSSLADDLVSNLTFMKSVYRAQYAPAEWKKSYAGYDLDAEYARAVDTARSTPNLTQKQSREILKNFIFAMKDYHVAISFISTEQASLPLVIKGTADRFFIMDIDRSKLSEDSFPFHIGDELVSFDGKPAAQAIAEVQAEIPANIPETDKAMAELNLTRRRASRGFNVPQGVVTLGIRRQGESQVVEHELIWEYTPEKIRERFSAITKQPADTARGEISLPQMSVTSFPQAGVQGGLYDVGGRKTFTPALGVKVWESSEDEPFHAYIYKTADRKLIGYVRIQGYIMPDYKEALASFAKVIGLFESTTDAMVIDQVNNPGGSVFYLYGLASMLTTQPLKTPLHRMSLTQADVMNAQQALSLLDSIKNEDDAKKKLPPEEMDGYPASYEFARLSANYSRFLISEWNAGRRLTRPYWIGGVNQINPAPVHYTKPILLLVNQLDFSGGDFFPAILQDNKRVTILGTRTAGAGGYVQDVKYPNSIGVDSFRVTASIAKRVNDNPIENLGVKPDIEYSMSVTDYTQNYPEYVQAIQSAVNALTR